MNEPIIELRATLANLQDRLIEAEADLADRQAEIYAFELEFEARVGHLIDMLADLEREIQRYHERINITRNKQTFGYAYVSVEEQYRRTWQPPPPTVSTPPSQPPSPVDEAEIKRLYRQLARRCGERGLPLALQGHGIRWHEHQRRLHHGLGQLPGAASFLRADRFELLL